MILNDFFKCELIGRSSGALTFKEFELLGIGRGAYGARESRKPLEEML